ncbi:PGN_0703 family putative restriction endonuclease [Aureispira sp. CCB-E]|uniref:PGN_0703 family putative restriction endonuclease n=1 Tax=Aureispira sp. CCB-E TaxID=3051121 RepID=UPI002868D69B|nr:hypothetical protein [Aureispira sp. CCB-E]WMX16502.1 hypothetical protein QP953_09000 [Aureispira sp. CCB-E]
MRPSKKTLEKHNAFYKPDSDYASFARLLQCKWREKQNYPIQEGKLGNFLPIDFAKSQKVNFLTDRIKALAQYEVYNICAQGGLIGEPRLWNNLLSSQPLCFNLFGELHFDLELASKFFREFFPERIKEVTAVKFEYSPGRGAAKYTGDYSAFDAFIEYLNLKGEKSFIGIEVKYAEDLKDDKKKAAATYEKHKDRYTELSLNSELFPKDSIKKLQELPLQQVWRDHLLSIATQADYEDGFFIYLFPSQNQECQDAVDNYVSCLISEDKNRTGFYPCHLESFIKVLRKLVKKQWTRELTERYLG